ncbi:MAG: carbon storage regulator [Planctomycetaceae bacterium]|nr:carbon storage regulator [Planctomycetaceae bacterium]MBV8314357.1 carbon storage regulator [Planctomycetaceae bacterium]MBV8610807.1 carbon storage regulator [Singulisphaera sp.]
MLVLTRKLMEKLFIGDDICVTVVRLEGGQVRLGIEAPRNVSVVRAELVPERLGAQLKAAPRPPVAIRAELKTPPTAAHETGNRRRGRSR